jgi:HSP20 family protein
MVWTNLRRLGWDWDPLSEMRHLRNHLNELFQGASLRGAAEFPAVNIWSNNDQMILTAELPGVETEDIDISVQDDTLTLRGSRRPDELKEGETYHRQERGSGNFVRTLQLPYEVDVQKVQARLEKGILRIELSRSEQQKPKKIEVKTIG